MNKYQFGARGFVKHDGTILGWPVPDGDHNAYLRKHGLTDADFAARWRQWRPGGVIEIDDYSVEESESVALKIQTWLDENTTEEPNYEHSPEPA